MTQDYDSVTVNCTNDTKEALKNLAKFCSMTHRDLLKYLLMSKGVLPSDGTISIFDNWNNETIIRYKVFLDSLDKKK